MKPSKQQAEFKTQENPTDSLSRKRRAFIKGSAATLPVVLTLRNGSAFAAASISCLEKQKNIPAPTIIATEKADSFVRDPTKVRIMTPVPNGSAITIYNYPKGSAFWYRATDNSTSAALQEYTDTSGSTKVVVMVPFNSFNTVKYTFNSNNDTDGWILAQLTPSGVRALNAGTPIVGPKDTNQVSTIVATQSCATSLHP